MESTCNHEHGLAAGGRRGGDHAAGWVHTALKATIAKMASDSFYKQTSWSQIGDLVTCQVTKFTWLLMGPGHYRFIVSLLPIDCLFSLAGLSESLMKYVESKKNKKKTRRLS